MVPMMSVVRMMYCVCRSAVMGSARTAVTSLKLCFSKNCEPTLGIGTGYRAGPSDFFVSVLMPDRDLNAYRKPVPDLPHIYKPVADLPQV